MTAWYIDALDGLGGHAFASRRERDDGADAERTVFIAPPFFVPEAVTSRSPALASRRAAFQSGFFLHGEEYPFEQAEHVAEFVRRVYNGGNGGNGLGASPPPDQPREPPEDGPVPEWFGEGATTATLVDDACRAFVENAPRGGADAARWRDAWRDAVQGPPVDARLANPDPLLRALWMLLQEVAREPYGPELASVRGIARVRALHALARRALGSDGVRAFSEGLHPPPQPRHPLERVLEIFARLPPHDDTPPAEPFEALTAIPVPRGALPQRAREGPPSLADLLALTASSPRWIAGSLPRVYLFLFAATSLVAGDLFAGSGLGAAADTGEPALRDERATLAARAALRWCEASLPRFAFARAVEDAIFDAADLRYA